MMTRYRVLRGLGCNPFTSIAVSVLNALRGVPEGYIVLLLVTIEYDP